MHGTHGHLSSLLTENKSRLHQPIYSGFLSYFDWLHISSLPRSLKAYHATVFPFTLFSTPFNFLSSLLSCPFLPSVPPRWFPCYPISGLCLSVSKANTCNQPVASNDERMSSHHLSLVALLQVSSLSVSLPVIILLCLPPSYAPMNLYIQQLTRCADFLCCFFPLPFASLPARRVFHVGKPTARSAVSRHCRKAKVQRRPGPERSPTTASWSW